MSKTIIFDLSEVLIAGLLGVEKTIAAQIDLSPDQVLATFNTPALEDLFCGRLSEDSYLANILQHSGWSISRDQLKRIARANFHRRVPGMAELVTSLAQEYELALLSDHAREWIAYIQTIHPFLRSFAARFFSFNLQRTKRHPSTFQKILRLLNRNPGECLFIDDSLINIQAAQSIGLPSIQFTTARALVTELENRKLAFRSRATCLSS